MNEKIEKQIQDILASERIMPEDIPDIGLYMDRIDERIERKRELFSNARMGDVL